MSFVKITLATMLLSSTLCADDRMAATNGMMATQVVGAAVTSVSPLPESTLPEQKRTLILILGIAAVATTFHRALANRKTAL